MMSKHTKTLLEDLLNKFMVQQYSKNLLKNFIGLLIVLNDKEKQKFLLSLINCINKKPIESEFWSQMSNEHKTILNRTVLWLFTKSTYKTVGAFLLWNFIFENVTGHNLRGGYLAQLICYMPHCFKVKVAC